jgi:hypothetical protein
MTYVIEKSSSCLTENTSRLRYKAQPVNSVWGKSGCLLREPYEHLNRLWADWQWQWLETVNARASLDAVKECKTFLSEKILPFSSIP